MSTLISRNHHRILFANLVAQVAIIVSGGLVRLTGSGLGCPTWPQCVPGSYVPVREQAEGFHKVIEFGNRTLTSVLTVIAILTVLAVWQCAPVRRLKIAAATVLGGVIFQAALGGVTVLTELHPVTVAAHFLVSAGLVAAAAYLWFARNERDGEPVSLVPELVRRIAWLTSGVGAVVLVLGTIVTGSGPHSGDADAPARFGFDPRTISWLHADAVMLFVGLVVAVWLATRLSPAPASVSSAWRAVLLVTLAQGLIGYVQYLTDLPEVLVLTHMLGAAALIVALTNGLLALRRVSPHDVAQE
ncbi:putative cytochrome c oxidase subunit XV assembly protein [Janibacter sp. HTCC2649]|uniref:COX15/CtaA family protein n=1 Tax=Janibacter sp. HTCC2649 TaxID=313589 RepID=UPI000066EC33|nr:COX15/CtaA family protein [Janibacter sp. HTCC2649]EAP99187.1 putative cytochrome c oxidase subunit XV assembly protein [Janibacter sp. HTCC2649]